MLQLVPSAHKTGSIHSGVEYKYNEGCNDTCTYLPVTRGSRIREDGVSRDLWHSIVVYPGLSFVFEARLFEISSAMDCNIMVSRDGCFAEGFAG